MLMYFLSQYILYIRKVTHGINRFFLSLHSFAVRFINLLSDF